MKRVLFSLLTLSLSLSGQAAVETYKIDPAHSSVGFTIRHFFTKVPGQFVKFEGTITADRENLEKSSAAATVDVSSISTQQEKRDTHLKSKDFFAADKFPTITFKSKSWKKTGEDSFDVTGDLTIKDVTKEAVLKVKSLGFGPGPREGVFISGWEGTTTIKRADYNITGYEKVLGDNVDVTISIEAIRQ